MSHPICARCQLPTDAGRMLGGTCVDCFDSENGYVSKPTFEADGSVSFPVFDTADVQAALSSDVQPLFPARTYTSMDVLE